MAFNLSLSNIGWEQTETQRLFPMFRRYGVTGIEVAPTKIWPNWQGATVENARRYGEELLDEGFAVPALQAILFGRPDLQLFDQRTHSAFVEHIKHVSDLAAGLNAKVLVFGAPKNRRRGQVAMNDAMKIAAELFRNLGDICLKRGCCLGIEHNPVEYGCDFLTNVADVRALVEIVDHPGVQLHLDSGGIHMCGGNIADIIQSTDLFCHYHISEPMLAPIAGGQVSHESALLALKRRGYNNWVSVEMAAVPDLEPSLREVRRVLEATEQ